MENYLFSKINRDRASAYIYQTVEKRKLSNIYHSHDFYEWTIVLNGSCRQIINGMEIEMNKNACVILCPGDCHCFTAQSDDLKLVCLSVNIEETDRLAKFFGFDKGGIYYKRMLLMPSQTAPLIGLHSASNENEYKLIHANLIKIYIEESDEKSALPASIRYAMSEMTKLENLQGGSARFIEISNYSKTHLNRLLQKHMGVSLHEYIRTLRLETAYNLLVLSDVDIYSVAELLGYNSFSHFNRIFKEKFSITPSVVRRKYSVRTV